MTRHEFIGRLRETVLRGRLIGFVWIGVLLFCMCAVGPVPVRAQVEESGPDSPAGESEGAEENSSPSEDGEAQPEAVTTKILLAVLNPQSKLFGLSITEFSSTDNDDLQQQFLQKNLVTNKGFMGAYIEIFTQFVDSDESDRPRLDRIDLIEKWLDGFGKEGVLGETEVRLSRLFLELKRAIATRNDPQHDEVLARVEADVLALAQSDPRSEWGSFLTGLAVQLFEIEGRETQIEKDKEFYFNKASLEAKDDAQLHFLIGQCYLEYYDRRDVSNFLRLLATEMEKCLLIESTKSNKELWSAITGIYVQIHEQYQEQDTPEPFWFEELAYKRIIKLDPTNASAHNNLSFLYSQAGVQLKEALKESQIANQLVPDNPYLMDTLGWAQYKNRLLDEAMDTLRRAEAMDSEVADIHFHLATVYFDLDELAQASHHFKETIRLEPDNAFALNNLAYLYAEHGVELEEALNLVDRALERFGDNAAFIDTKGWILFKLNRLDESATQLKHSIELMSDSSELYLHLGHVYLKQGNFDLAVAQFDKALQLEPENQVLARGLAYTLARWGLRHSLERFQAIPAARKDPRLLKVFYDLIAQSHIAEGDYEGARHALEELEKAPRESPDQEALQEEEESSPDPEREVRSIEVDPELGALGITALLPSQSDLVVCLEKEGLIQLIREAIKHFPQGAAAGVSPEAGLNGVVSRVILGIKLDQQAEAGCGTVIFQLTPLAQAALSRVQNFAGVARKLMVGQIPVPVNIISMAYRDNFIYKIEVAGHELYLAHGGAFLALSCDRSELELFLDGGPLPADSFLSKPFVMDSQKRFGGEAPIAIFVDLDELPGPVRDRVPFLQSLRGLSALAARWNLAEENALIENLVAFPEADGDLEAVRKSLEASAEQLVSDLKGLGAQGVSLTHEIQEEKGIILGTFHLKGLEQFLSIVIQRFQELGMPTPPIGP